MGLCLRTIPLGGIELTSNLGRQLMKTLYPALEPYATYYLEVDSVHRVYVEECGSRFGLPVIFLHGGPASGCKLQHRCFFNPDKYRIILFDQRGAGRSMPTGRLVDNTTQHLIDDMETIRRKLGVDRWILFGGSWGAALALLYAQKYPERVSGLVVRGVFLARQRDLDWLVGDGASRIYPEQWRRLCACIPKSERSDLIEAMQRRLHGADELAQRRVAREWEAWGSQVSLGHEFARSDSSLPAPDLVQQVRIEMHYAGNAYFLKENQIMEKCERIPDVPIIIIHGRFDLVCPIESAFSLHQKLPATKFEILPNSGHVARGEEMIDALVRATGEMAERVAS